ncbi:MAG TPA: M1 family metallopeptidase [Cyclobacteriaceae bacterium]|nr:M1 family metallopeptidase [Cyclobacteriaceae bacterium]
MKRLMTAGLCLLALSTFGQEANRWEGKFEQLGPLLPTPNEYRTGSGSPGPSYWQQRADYEIEVELNDDNQTITGKETITYHNNAPESLSFLWLQLDQNILADDNLTSKTKTNQIKDGTHTREIVKTLDLMGKSGGYNITSVKSSDGQTLPFTVNYTMMRVDLPTPLKTGETYRFSIEWSYNIGDRMIDGQRSGLEYFEEDKNYVYTIAQFFPRMCVFDDYEGWQNKQFLGRGEFALPFGSYKVKITVPADHVVAATGTLQNADQVLTPEQQERLRKARTTFDKPVFIITEAEARANEASRSRQKKTWEFHADSVRDFAFATSRKFIWDAMAVKLDTKTPMAMSFYPKEGNPLWEQESTKAVKNTLITYSKYTFDYPYPVAISVHTADIGMEYPMICFNYGRPVNGKYTEAKKYGMIGVIIHEIGHNFFPMIVNNDERQWAWMDEGLNTFLQYRTEVEQYENFPSRRGPAELLIPYMKGGKETSRPLMTNPEQIIQLGAEQYAKCATALSILREVIMGPELFDFAFKEYARRWAFKHPQPADFFRTMEDASAVDLDWFWKGWFYTTESVDQAVNNVTWYRLDAEKANLEGRDKKSAKGDLGSAKPGQSPFDAGPRPFHVVPTDARFYGEFRSRIDDKEALSKLEGKNLYEVELSNEGGLVMPVIIQWNYRDGTSETEQLPAEIWRTNERKITRVFVKDKEVVSVVLDPLAQTTDIDTENNVFPRETKPGRFDSFKKNATR